MSKKINIAVIPPVLLPANLVHIGTEYKISKTLLFTEEDLLVNLISTEDLYEKKFELDITDEDTFYVVTRYQYKQVDVDGDVLGEDGLVITKMGTPSMVTPFKGDQSGVKISDTIVKTPIVTKEVTYDYVNSGNIKLIGSKFEMFSSIGLHQSTSWIVTDLNGNVLFKRDKDVDNLTSIVLPKTFNVSDNMLIYCAYHSDTNADSNYGLLVNITNNKLPMFDITMYGDLYVKLEAQFRVKLINSLFKKVVLIVKDGETEVARYTSTKDVIIVPTYDLVIGKTYHFEFTVTSANDLAQTYTITKIAKDYNSKFKTKEYLDVYDYSGLLVTNGNTRTLSYQLHNGAILLSRNDSKCFCLARYTNGNLTFVNDVIQLPLNVNMLEPTTFVKELVNGDVVVSYVSSDIPTFGKTFIAVYEHIHYNNVFKLKNSIQITTEDELVSGGSITTMDNFVYYVQYNRGEIDNKFIKLDPYTGVRTTYNLPTTVNRGLSVVATRTGDIILFGGTDDDLSDYTTMHVRTNHKVFKFSIVNEIFVELGTDLLATVNPSIYQFHGVLRLDGNITIFNNINNNNIDVIADQSTYIINLEELTTTYLDNDHLDILPYGNTVVLSTGDIVRFSNMDRVTQKVYTYISDSMNLSNIDDNNTISYDGLNLVIGDNQIIPKSELCRYDTVTIEPGGLLILVTAKGNEKLYSDTLVVTRDMVMDNLDFIANGYSNVVMACDEATLILK